MHEFPSSYSKVMSTDEFREFIKQIWEANGKNYLQTAAAINHDPNTIRRIITKGSESKTLRKKLGIKKSNRTRVSFECSLETRQEISSICEEDGIERKDLLPEMIKAYRKYKIDQKENNNDRNRT